MALFRKDRTRTDSTAPLSVDAVPPEAPAPAPRGGDLRAAQRGNHMPSSFDGGAVTAFLGQGTRLAGRIAFEGPARIEGEVEGEIQAPDSLFVGESAVLNAQISGGTIVIHGKVTGDITATRRLEIRAPGKVYGNLTTPSLVIEDGVVFEGHCSMGATESRAGKVTILAKEEKSAATQTPALKAQGGESK